MHPFRDKDYLLAENGLIFNVLGDHHTDEKITAGLKYTSGIKWTGSYQQAIEYLSDSFPQYIDRWIQVPLDQVSTHLKPMVRLQELMKTPQALSTNLHQAVLLAECLSHQTSISTRAMGITDSLLWGTGNENSDIDLAIYGLKNIHQFCQQSSEIFKHNDFKAIEPEFIQRPPFLSDQTFERILRRKLNQGYFQGKRFSIRGVLKDSELELFPDRTRSFKAVESIETHATIAGTLGQLLYPIQYETDQKSPIVSFHVGYEMAFRPGDRVRVRGMLESTGERSRIVVGSAICDHESIEWIN